MEDLVIKLTHDTEVMVSVLKIVRFYGVSDLEEHCIVLSGIPKVQDPFYYYLPSLCDPSLEPGGQPKLDTIAISHPTDTPPSMTEKGGDQ